MSRHDQSDRRDHLGESIDLLTDQKQRRLVARSGIEVHQRPCYAAGRLHQVHERQVLLGVGAIQQIPHMPPPVGTRHEELLQGRPSQRKAPPSTASVHAMTMMCHRLTNTSGPGADPERVPVRTRLPSRVPASARRHHATTRGLVPNYKDAPQVRLHDLFRVE